MFNIGGGEMLIIFLVALMVLGPSRLPEAARQGARILGELRRVSSGFQREFQAAMKDPVSSLAATDATSDNKAAELPDVTAEPPLPPIDTPAIEDSIGGEPVNPNADPFAGSTRPVEPRADDLPSDG